MNEQDPRNRAVLARVDFEKQEGLVPIIIQEVDI